MQEITGKGEPIFGGVDYRRGESMELYADINKAIKIIVNSKMRRTGICGALETLLIDRHISEKAVPIIVKNLTKSGCHIRGDIETKQIVNEIELASEKDWHTEYLDAILSLKLVKGVLGAIDHISKYSSNHTESIITENTKVAETFLNNVDSAIAVSYTHLTLPTNREV